MPYVANLNMMAEFQKELIGTWTNQDIGVDEHRKPVGGKEHPLSYNIMPLPQQSDPDGYILKNFTYYETIKFNDDNADDTLAIAATAPNRGGIITQNARALFYEQQVKFAQGPAINSVVHVENGAWLSLSRFVQKDGPFPPPPEVPVSDALQQPSDLTVAKQIAVPHGNSILALGSFDTVSKAGGHGLCKKDPRIGGTPLIPDAPFPYPTPATPELNVDHRYTQLQANPQDFQNPHPDLTQCPNKPLQRAVEIIKPNTYMHWHVTTEPLRNVRGHVTNIPFEQRVSNVTSYWADYWLLSTDNGMTFKYLAYTQTILMEMTVKDERYVFPHVTCNTVAKI